MRRENVRHKLHEKMIGKKMATDELNGRPTELTRHYDPQLLEGNGRV